jgi:hypothetical protein
MAVISNVYLRNIGLSHIKFIDTDMQFSSGELSTMCGLKLEDKCFNPGRKSNSRNGIYNANKVHIICSVTVRYVHSATTVAVQAKYSRLLKRNVIIRR